ncbi:MAG TPA: (2Fe-2S)-binding protein [Pseudomonadota bacterium]|nr:(2Fe-2S)-binding protein [Pseudomonadota bacterium]
MRTDDSLPSPTPAPASVPVVQTTEPADEPGGAFSRRSFFKQAGGVAGAAVLISKTPQAEAAQAQTSTNPVAQVLGPKAVPATLLVNGKAQKLMIEPSETLAQVLREKLGLTGTKQGCERGACGACTVLIAGKPMLACMTLALDVAGLPGQPAGQSPPAVTTVEGLSKGTELHPLQQAFVEKDALQCGFCTSGMLMSCAALYEKAKTEGKLAALTDGDVKHALAGNLCRCGAYPHITQAVLAAAQGGKK